MTGIAARVVEHVHGHLGWLAAAALLHPAILLARRNRRAVLACLLATALATATGFLGFLLYPDYRRAIKPVLFEESPRIGWAFERKEHLAIAAIALAWAGLGAHWSEPRAHDAASRATLRRAAWLAYAAAAALATAAAILGVLVATHRTF
jgi:hypothetical protein